jgi:hypothetical protein
LGKTDAVHDACPLLNQVVAAGRPDDLLMVDRLKCWKFSKGSPVAGQLVRTDCLWDVEFAKQARQERSCPSGISGEFEQDVEHDPMLVYGPPAGRSTQARPLRTRTASGGYRQLSYRLRPYATGNPVWVPGNAANPDQSAACKACGSQRACSVSRSSTRAQI